MTQQRDPKMQTQPEGKASPVSRERKISGFGARGEGIRVHGDEPFDPHRFQDFEVTPAFRQRILEAPLPLLELRDLLADQVPQSQQRPRAGADDITQPAIPASNRSGEMLVAGHSNPESSESEEPLPLTQTVDRDADTAKLRPCPKAEVPNIASAINAPPINASPIGSRSTQSSAQLPKRSLWVAGAVGLLFLGLAFAYLNKAAPVASPPQISDIEVPLLPGPETAQNPAPQPQNLEMPAATPNHSQASSQPGKADPSSIKDPSRHAANSAKPNSKAGNTKKTLWLPAE